MWHKSRSLYPWALCYTYAISGLRRKRACLAGEIEIRDRATAKMREQLTAIDATLRLFHPDADPEHITPIRPFVIRNVWFRRRKQTRLVLEAMRDAGKPLPLSQIADYVMRTKGITRDDAGVWLRGREHVLVALLRLGDRGQVRKIIGAGNVVGTGG
jgi:hypothetical protein